MPRQTTSPFNHPQAVLQQIEQLAHHIAIARKRRGESQLQWARKLGVSQPTMARIERGDPSVAMASYVMCIWLINPSAGLADLIAPVSDHAALEQEVARVRAKAGPKTPRQPARAAQTRSADMPSLQSSIPRASEIAHLVADPMADIQKSLANKGPGSAVAQGLAALMLAKPVAKKNG